MGRLLEGAERHTGRQALIEIGAAYRFQSVQGLNDNDNQLEAQAGLMSALCLANKKMRDSINERTTSRLDPLRHTFIDRLRDLVPGITIEFKGPANRVRDAVA
ncbi:MAG: hypothetical protein ACI9X4_000902 [Glaciecola sp.]|jgi:hypothetical protein